MRRTVGFALLFAMAFSTALASDGPPAMGGMSVAPDLNPPDVTEFVVRLKKAVADRDKAAVATMVHYPLRCGSSPRNVKFYRNSTELRLHYDQVFTPEVIASITSAEPGHLFSRDQGTMTHGGMVWMRAIDDGPVKIITVNHTR